MNKKERGLIFNGEMVRATLGDRKSQTRRTRGLNKVNQNPNAWTYGGINIYKQHIFYPVPDEYPDDFDGLVRCPYGVPGDQLWVRETWRSLVCGGLDGYEADGSWVIASSSKKPSIHMPRQYSRILLEIANVRVERVQDISDDDAGAEGIFNNSGLHLWHCWGQQFHPDQMCGCGDNYPSEEFGKLWDTINAKRGCGWDVNPWVWVIEFKVLEK